MNKTSAPFPEELLREILVYRLSQDERYFCSFPENGCPRWMDRRPSRTRATARSRTNVLLVCKQWLRIATPILYEKVSLWYPEGTKAVAALVKSSPEVGRAIRYLRLEGGMGKDLHTIIKGAPNIHTLWITPHIRSSEGIAGLRKSLALLQPRNLYLLLSRHLKHNKSSTEAQGLILSAISSTWKELVSHQKDCIGVCSIAQPLSRHLLHFIV